RQPYRNLVSRFSCMIECKSSEIYPYESNIDDDFMKHYKLRVLVVGCIFTQGIVSSIPIGGSISPGGFLPSILLLVVIMVVVVIVVVTVILVVIVVVKMVIAIIGVVVVVGDVSSILKLSFMIIGDLVGLLYPNRLGICIPPRQGIVGVSLGSRFLLVSLVLIACVSRAAAMPSVISRWMVARVMAGVSDVDVLLGGIIST
nr:hypothetical protein [Tanacetum cinerariifolium]